jgi:microsomal dipeptidase-like Zn-dependent dipeptidase
VKRLAAAAAVVAALVVAAGAIVPGRVERRFNRVQAALLPVPPKVRAWHRRLLVADLHADTLLWDRDLLARGSRGHVDVPRLVEGGVALQAFTVVTKAPHGLNIHRNSASTADDVTWLALAQGWPPATWRSLKARALYQARRLHDAARRSGGRLTVIRDRAGLEAFLARREREPGLVGALLGLEGAHAFEGDLASLEALDAAGFRMIGLAHFFDNEWAGSAHGVVQGGLTPLGRTLVRRLEERRILLDLAHASPAAVADALEMARRPVVVSHTGVRGTCDNERNLSDDQLRAVARTGGVVGIGFWSTAVCGGDASAIARAALHAVRVMGVDHVALGSDFDGGVTTPFDATGYEQVTAALLAAGLPEDGVAKVMGENVRRLWLETLP